jgi:hypothetical protein
MDLMIPGSVVAAGVVALSGYLAKVFIAEHLVDRRTRRAADQQAAAAQTAAFKAHIDDCAKRAQDAARLTESVDQLKCGMDSLHEKTDKFLVEMTRSSAKLDSHLAEYQRFQARIERSVAQ